MDSVKPICYDLFCGLGGWSEAFIAEGYRAIGFDIEAHEYGDQRYPGELRIRDVRSIHGSELKDAAVIVASPPCQEYSYMAMPWSKAKAKQAAILADTSGAAMARLNDLFNQCFRIQREAIEAAGHWIPMVVENVRGAQKWVGRARWNYGSFYLWGDLPALMPHTFKGVKVASDQGRRTDVGNGTRFTSRDCGVEGQKVPGFRFDGSGKSFQTASVEGTKNGNDWFGPGENCSLQRRAGSKSNARKAASAMIARIPFSLASHIAKIYYPHGASDESSR